MPTFSAKHRSYFLGILIILVSLSWFLFAEYLRRNTPDQPNAAAGQTYAVSFHGTYGYLTASEFYLFYSVPTIGFAVGLPVGIYKLLQKARRK